MIAKKTILAAAALAALTATGIGAAQAQPLRDFGHRAPLTMQVTMHRPMERGIVTHARVMQTLRMHRLVAMGQPFFSHGRYLVRSHDRMGRIVLVQLDPWTGRFIGIVRI